MAYSNEELITMARQGDLLAKDKLFKQNERFCYTMAGKFKSIGMDYEELLSLANIGMVIAFNTFDESKGFKFISYAGGCISNEILKEFRRFKKKFGKEFVSLDDNCFDNGEGKTMTYAETIADTSPTPDKVVEHEDDLARLNEAMKFLNDKDRSILEMYYFQDMTMCQIADTLNTSQANISRIISKKLRELKKIMETITLPTPEPKKRGRKRTRPIVERTEPKRKYTRREKLVEPSSEVAVTVEPEVLDTPAPVLEAKKDIIEDSITDIQKYNNGMRKSMMDKLWFMDKIGDESYNLVDYGCADGSMMKEIHRIDESYTFLGYDNSPEMLVMARNNFPEAWYFTKWNDLISSLNNTKKSVLNISSLIHEVYSYCTEPTIKEFWNDVFNSASFEFISIRDMSLSQTALRVAPVEDVAKIYHYANKELLAEFEAKWGSIYYLPNMLHWLLKYRYTTNWQREVKENYLPVTVEDLFRLIPMDKYKIVHYEHYTLPFLKDVVKNDFDIELKESTHVKILLQRR